MTAKEAIAIANATLEEAESRRLQEVKREASLYNTDHLTALLRTLMQRAWMRGDYREADEISDAIGEPRPSDHERGDL